MTHKPNREIIPLIKKEKDKKLSRQETFFNSRIRKIRELKEKLARAQELMEVFQTRASQELIPLEQEVAQTKAAFVRLLDQYYGLKYFRKREKEKIAHIIREESYNLIYNFDLSDLEPIYNKYNEQTFEEDLADYKEFQQQFTANMLENMFGLDPEDIKKLDLDNVEEVKAFIEDQIAKRRAETKEPEPNRKKTSYQKHQEKKQKQEAEKISKTTRTLYTELVKVLHPDKELDEQKRQAKTEIMQRVTAAYQQDDYFELMRLQIEHLESLGGGEVSQIADERLKYYNKILLDQKRELENQWHQLTGNHQPLGFQVKQWVQYEDGLDFFLIREK
ncbi:MAG: hypothetical protein HC880_06260 [Bacteroidia bacterium]|nr:hypothetical protein [Bacteroidia bacterium]